MKNFLLSLIAAILSSSALYVFLRTGFGFDSVYWIGVFLYSFIWVFILAVPVVLILKKYGKMKTVIFSLLGASCAALSVTVPHLKDVYFAKMSSLTLRQGQNILFEKGVITEYGVSQFYEGLLFSFICGAVGGVIFGVLLKKSRKANMID